MSEYLDIKNTEYLVDAITTKINKVTSDMSLMDEKIDICLTRTTRMDAEINQLKREVEKNNLIINGFYKFIVILFVIIGITVGALLL